MSTRDQNLNRGTSTAIDTGAGLAANRPAGPAEAGVKINGLEQVVEMLRYADPTFRESLLRRLGQKDPQLASNLRKILR